MYILSDVWLDNRKVMTQLRVLFVGLESNDVIPDVIVFMGNFTSRPFGHEHADSSRLKHYYQNLAELISQFPKIAKTTKFVFIPGPTDPGPNVLPRPALPSYLTVRAYFLSFFGILFCLSLSPLKYRNRLLDNRSHWKRELGISPSLQTPADWESDRKESSNTPHFSFLTLPLPHPHISLPIVLSNLFILLTDSSLLLIFTSPGHPLSRRSCSQDETPLSSRTGCASRCGGGNWTLRSCNHSSELIDFFPSPFPFSYIPVGGNPCFCFTSLSSCRDIETNLLELRPRDATLSSPWCCITFSLYLIVHSPCNLMPLIRPSLSACNRRSVPKLRNGIRQLPLP